MTNSIVSETSRVFPCPSCGEMIYSSVEKCRFCSATVDPQTAARGAEHQAKINAACNHAKMLRNGAGVMWVFFLLSAIPFLPFGWGYIGMFFVIPVWLFAWPVKFGRLESSDADYKRAKRDWLIALICWLAALAFEVFAFFGRDIREVFPPPEF